MRNGMGLALAAACLVAGAAQGAPVLHNHNNKALLIKQGGQIVGFAHARTEENVEKVHWHFCGGIHSDAPKCQAAFDPDKHRTIGPDPHTPDQTYGAWKKRVYGPDANSDTPPPSGSGHCILHGKPPAQGDDGLSRADLEARKGSLNALNGQQPDYGITKLVRGASGVGVVLRLGKAEATQHEYWALDDDFAPVDTAELVIRRGIWRQLDDVDDKDTVMRMGLRLVSTERRAAGTSGTPPYTTVHQVVLNPETGYGSDCKNRFDEVGLNAPLSGTAGKPKPAGPP
ncbi:MAG: hypothetical protein KC613_06745 [Myxococcales bacterium]|nr:hypothetical protein [Myxococcales bacterium]